MQMKGRAVIIYFRSQHGKASNATLNYLRLILSAVVELVLELALSMGLWVKRTALLLHKCVYPAISVKSVKHNVPGLGCIKAVSADVNILLIPNRLDARDLWQNEPRSVLE